MKGRVLIVAGSDSGGGAGIQADIKAVTALHGFAMTAVTALTAQNTLGVHDVHPVDTGFIQTQMHVVLSDLGADSLKTGMLHSSAVIEAVCEVAETEASGIPLVVDPVMISSSGTPLLKPSAAAALARRLLPLARLVTPNLDEAATLAKQPVREPEAMREAARAIHERFGCAVLVKGGHLKTTEAIDLFYDGREEFLLSAPRVRGVSPPGTGCTYSAAITAFLAKGEPLPKAVERAKQHMAEAISAVYRAGKHRFLG